MSFDYSSFLTTSGYFEWISALIESQHNYADSALDTVKGYLDDLDELLKETNLISTTVPDIVIDIPGSIVMDPSLISLMPAPPTDILSFDKEAPSMSDHPFPSAKTYTLPDVPVLHDIVLPSFVSQEVAGMSATLPVLDFSVPSISSIDNGGLAPHDTLMESIKDKLNKNITEGGTMLDPSVEADIWNRDLERRVQVLQDQKDKIVNEWSKLGWSLPDGLLSGMMQAIEAEYLNKNLESSRTIAIEQAKLEHDGMFKSLEIGTSLEKAIMDSFNHYATRIFEASKAAATVTLDIFKSRVELYNANLATYKADADVFKAKIDAEIGRAQAYKAQIEGLAIIGQLDETQVKLYTGQIEGINTLVKVYQTEVQATAALYEAEKVKIERFKTEVEAYVAEVEADIKKYAVSVDNFKAYVTAYAANADAQAKLYQVRGSTQVAKAEAEMKAWDIQLKLIQEDLQTRLEATKALAQIAGNLAAGAMSACHAGLSAGISGVASFSQVT